MMEQEFEWDEGKAESNLKKHGVSFEAARLAFDDAFALDRLDTTMVYPERKERIRIISARSATRHEEKEYHRGKAQE